MRFSLMPFVQSLVDVLLPPHRDVQVAKTVTIENLLAIAHEHEVHGASWIHSILPYHDERVRAVIRSIKYYGDTYTVEKIATILTPFVIEQLSDLKTLGGWGTVVIVPIPSSPERRKKRGYNQAERIAKGVVGQIGGLRMDTTLLIRDERPSQAHVRKSDRAENSKGAFHATRKATGLYILLIDDVVETGSTLKDAKRALLEAGASGVEAFAVAH